MDEQTLRYARCAAMFFATLLAANTVFADPQKLSPPPTKAAAAETERTIRDLYKKEYASRNPDERAAFGRMLLKQGLESSGDAIARYVLLRDALEVACSAGDVLTALKAYEQLSKEYSIRAIAVKAAMISALGKTVRSIDGARELVAQATSLIDEAVAADDYDLAKQAGNAAITVSRKANNPALAAAVQSRIKEIDLLRRDFEKTKAALATLKDNPDNSAARLTAGRYYCVSKQDFDSGLNWLQSCDDPALESLAQADIKSPSEPAEQFRLGESWHEYGSKQREPERTAWLSRAAFWYAKAAPKLDGIAKLKADAKLKQLASESAEKGQPVTPELLINSLTHCSWRIEWNDGSITPSLTFRPDGAVNSQSHNGTWKIERTEILFLAANGEVWRHRLVNGRLLSESYMTKDSASPTRQGVGTPVP